MVVSAKASSSKGPAKENRKKRVPKKRPQTGGSLKLTGVARPFNTRLLASRFANIGLEDRQMQLRSQYGDTRVELAEDADISFDPYADSANSQETVRVDKTTYVLNNGAVSTFEQWEDGKPKPHSLQSACWLVPEHFSGENVEYQDARGSVKKLNSASISFKNESDQLMRIYINAPKASLNLQSQVKYREEATVLELQPNGTGSMTTGFKSEQRKMPVIKENGSGRNMNLLFDYVVTTPGVSKFTGTEPNEAQPIVSVHLSVNYTIQGRIEPLVAGKIANATQTFEIHLYSKLTDLLSTEEDPATISYDQPLFPKVTGGARYCTLRAFGSLKNGANFPVMASTGNACWGLFPSNDRSGALPKAGSHYDWSSFGFRNGDLMVMSFPTTVGQAADRATSSLFMMVRATGISDYRGGGAEDWGSAKLVAVLVTVMTSFTGTSGGEKFCVQSVTDAGWKVDMYNPILSDGRENLVLTPPFYRLAVNNVASVEGFFSGLFKVLTVATKVVEVLNTMF